MYEIERIDEYIQNALNKSALFVASNKLIDVCLQRLFIYFGWYTDVLTAPVKQKVTDE